MAKILVVDDSKLIVAMLTDVLSSAGHEVKAAYNGAEAIAELRKEKPDLIISSGAAVAVPFFWLGKLMGAKLIYIEVFDRIDKPTLTGKMVYPIVDKFIVEWDEMKKVYPKSVNLGSIF